jgi:hypothetical protein
MALSEHSLPASRTPRLIACGYELDASRLCGKPAVTILHKRENGNLYLCKRHATTERIAYALAHGWTVRAA